MKKFLSILVLAFLYSSNANAGVNEPGSGHIGALGSKKTHANRCTRLTESGFTDEQIKKIFGPIGIKLGGRSAPEIALSIIAQLVFEVYNK